MNMVEEQMVTFKFNKENPYNYLAPLHQQSWSQPTKAATPKAKGAKPNSFSSSTSNSMK